MASWLVWVSGSRLMRIMPLIGALLALAGCIPAKAPTSSADELPANAIPVGNDLYMVPIAVDDDGCEIFSETLPGRPLPAIVYYRRSDGTFTRIKAEADCAVRSEPAP